MEEIKRCNNCGRFLGVSSFRTSFDKRRNKSYTRGECKKCASVNNSIWCHENRDYKQEYTKRVEYNKLYYMNWDYNKYTVDIDSFDPHAYNSQNFFLSETPLTNDGVDVEGSIYLHHRFNTTDHNTIITEN